MLFDTHMHADYSCDAHMTITDAMAAAQKLAIGMILTEHWDRFYPTNPDKFLFDIDDYFAKNTKYRSEKVLLGIEVCMQPAAAPEDNKMIAAHPFDEVIGSMHCVLGKDIYEPTAYEGMDKDTRVRTYLEDTIRCLQLYPDFDTLGHIDYICRYMPYEDKNLYYKEHADLWDKVFSMLAEENKAIEINTRRLSDKSVISPLLVLYKRFKELGGKYMTLGSDAHYTEHVGRDLDVAADIARESGLKIVHFKQRKMIIDE